MVVVTVVLSFGVIGGGGDLARGLTGPVGWPTEAALEPRELKTKKYNNRQHELLKEK